ncbi:MAG: aspartyl/asparaginyl beta-hydroxylase domain-containing protein [Xenococcaceae cyanobacterium MO_188.B32]|nr:aspartyl/asparaginyl beta-hydroxylase domain-containing protein [Xenococcaceae cyanobacterium MO_188.B32]
METSPKVRSGKACQSSWARFDLKKKIRDLIVYDIGFKLLKKYEQLIPEYSLIGTTPFLDTKQFSWTEELEANWLVIRQELDKILEHKEELPNFQDISPDQGYSTTQDNLWKTYFLYGYGIKVNTNCQRCPETTRSIEKIPGMKTAFFSILLPNKHIPEHRGPYKGVVRYHLALKVPEPRQQCGIRVANEVRHWQEGKGMLFDDSFPHEAWNETDGVRVVLFMDIVRPMGFPLSWLNHLLLKIIALSPFVRDAHANQKKWDERLEKLFGR